MSTPNPVPVLSNDEVQRVWVNNKIGELIISPEIDALCATVRALRVEVERLKNLSADQTTIETALRKEVSELRDEIRILDHEGMQ